MGAGPPDRPCHARGLQGQGLEEMESGHAACGPVRPLAVEDQRGARCRLPLPADRAIDPARGCGLPRQRLRPRPRGRGNLPPHRGHGRLAQAGTAPVGGEPGGGGHPGRVAGDETRIRIPRARMVGGDQVEGGLADRHEREPRVLAALQRTVQRGPRADADARHDRGTRPADQEPQTGAVLDRDRGHGRMAALQRTDRQQGCGDAAVRPGRTRPLPHHVREPEAGERPAAPPV